MIKKVLFFVAAIFCIGKLNVAFAQDLTQLSSASVLPIFIADSKNPNDYQLFANSGWDGNWALKADTCWIQKLYVAQSSESYRAFLGAKIGRAKTRKNIDPLLAQGLEGQIYIAVNSTFGWTSDQNFLLTENSFVPLEGLSDSAVEGVESSQWFWVEVPSDKINWQGENYLALWTPSSIFVDASSSSILAGSWGNAELNSWVAQKTKGRLPYKIAEKSLVPFTLFEPAIAIKLVSKNVKANGQIQIVKIEDGSAKAENLNTKIVWANAEIPNVVSVWLQASKDGEKWIQLERTLRQAPYSFTVNLEEVLRYLGSRAVIRVVAQDVNQNMYYSVIQPLFSDR